MARKDKPLEVTIPRPVDERPPWSKVGIIGLAGFVIGIAWPRVAGIKIGPSVPVDVHAAHAEASGEPGASAAPPAAPAASGTPAAAASGEPAAGDPGAANRELVVVGSGKIIKCWDKKDKKVDDCGKLQFDPIALPKLKDLSKCPSALGLEGKLAVGFEIDFQKKEVHVTKGKKTSLPSSTVSGVLQCAARDFANVALEEVPHKYRRYSLAYATTFYPPGKHPAEAQAGDGEGSGEQAAGATTSDTPASTTSATVTWDTALIRKDPKDGEVVARLVRGTRVKVIARQNDWYRVESGAKVGWIYRGAIGL
jgi:hypothetical protein